MKIGAHVLRNALFVAPMAGVTDRPFRQLARRFGAGLAVSEMVASRPELRGSRKSRLRLDHEGEAAPISGQIAGAGPALMADAARYNGDRGAQIIDINMGCPAKTVCNAFAGPALLSGRAAAVFFHEVLGHRLEGFRQKQLTEGQTFTNKVGQVIMPTFLSVYDDPTLNQINGQSLLGYYPFDDEGVAAQRVTLVDHGVLKNFLISRSPLPGFPHSNGHGRRQLSYQPIARMGNTIVRSSKGVPFAELRKMLIQMIRSQGKPFGLLIDDISGGFTITGRQQPQAFQVEPLIVYKVYADGRPDELVRGVNIVGTPLTSLTKIVATGDKDSVFDGYCVDESGAVPVSADAPAMLFSELEVAKKETSTDKPPILPAPAHDPQNQEPRGVKPTPWGQLT